MITISLILISAEIYYQTLEKIPGALVPEKIRKRQKKLQIFLKIA